MHAITKLRVAVSFALALAALAATPELARAENPFGTWAVVVVAGDARAQSGGQSEAFDNARRDIVWNLVGLGFNPANIRQFSAQANRFGHEGVGWSEGNAIHSSLQELSRQAYGGCLIYFTSHGSEQGIVVGNYTLSPQNMAQIVNNSCGDRLTVIVMSACHSGVFVPALSSANRMVMTASRADRSSFGCGEGDRYPYFDACFLEEVIGARNFATLGLAMQQCVARKEYETGSSPPSEPQVVIGEGIGRVLPTYAFAHGIGACGVTTREPADTGGC
jgi:hypothetical protein